LSSRFLAINSPLHFRQGRTQEHFPLSLSEYFELLAHSIVTLFIFFSTMKLDVGLLHHRRA
jgi:hypothetical protein